MNYLYVVSADWVRLGDQSDTDAVWMRGDEDGRLSPIVAVVEQTLHWALAASSLVPERHAQLAVVTATVDITKTPIQSNPSFMIQC